jgi:riboflavin synthase
MFTGIVEAVGKIESMTPSAAGARLGIDAGGLELTDVKAGDSIAVSGVCLTVTSLAGCVFTVDVSRETLDCTQGLDRPGAEVNLERALRLADRLGGHLVSGHVDGVGEVTAFEPEGECWRLAVRAPEALAKYIAPKGSITVNGVSLTVNRVRGREFEVNLIPHTLEMTNLRHIVCGSRVNLEADMVARYVERLLSTQREVAAS